MPKMKAVRREVTFRQSELNGFLDMLRYDGCTVVRWANEVSETADYRNPAFKVVLESKPGYDFTPARWASFGIVMSEPIDAFFG